MVKQPLINSRFKKSFTDLVSKKVIETIKEAWTIEKDKIVKEIMENDGIKTEKSTKKENDDLGIKLPFQTSFYQYVADITVRNVRNIEAILPRAYSYHIKNMCDRSNWELGHCGVFQYEECKSCSNVNFNNNFCKSFIKCFQSEEHLLLDLVLWKTTNVKKALDGNPILKIVLEFFSQNELIDGFFYKEMERYGIIEEDARAAINVLQGADYCLIDPDHSYGVANNYISERYKINRKGKMYIKSILKLSEYYKAFGVNKPERSYINSKR